MYGIDVARGVCLVLMMIQHLPGNILRHYTNQMFGIFGFFTAASGFIFLSGFVTASVYSSVLLQQGFKAACRRALRRAAELYFVNILMFLLAFAGILFHFFSAPFWKVAFGLLYTDPGRALCLGMIFIYRPWLFDILPMYVLFLVISVPVLVAIHSGHRWTVLGLSALVWLGIQFYSSSNMQGLNPLGYQICFVGGLAVGSIQDVRKKLFDPRIIRSAQIAVVITLVLLLLRFWMGQLRNPEPDFPFWHSLVDLQRNGLIRILNFSIFGFSVAFLWVRISERLKKILPFQWLSYIGRHSLQVFVWSVFVAYFMHAVVPSSAGRMQRLANILIAVPSLTIPAFLHERFKKRTVRG
jgi:hypothetical protein